MLSGSYNIFLEDRGKEKLYFCPWQESQGSIFLLSTHVKSIKALKTPITTGGSTAVINSEP